MPKMPCPCGHLIDMSDLPSKHQFLVMAGSSVELIVNDLVRAHKELNPKKSFENSAYASFILRSPRLPAFVECPACGRLLLFEHSSLDAPPIVIYKPDTVGATPSRSLGSLFNKPPQSGDA